MAVFGLHQDAGPVGNQYSFVGSIAPIAQLAWQPFSSVLIVKVPQRSLMPPLVLRWGIAQTAMAACHNYSGLLATRFFLVLFEAGSASLWNHYQLVVSSLRAAHSSGSLVWDEWDGHHLSLHTLVRAWAYPIPHALRKCMCAPFPSRGG